MDTNTSEILLRLIEESTNRYSKFLDKGWTIAATHELELMKAFLETLESISDRNE